MASEFMDELLFRDRMLEASVKAVTWAQIHVLNRLPPSCSYLLYPNQSYDGNPLKADEEIFPADSIAFPKFIGPLGFEEACQFLWRKGKVPEWVDVSVQACDADLSYIQLRCCGRFTALQELLYHKFEGYQPFHVHSPPLPPDWKSLEESGKFDLYWHGNNALMINV